jgi:transposase
MMLHRVRLVLCRQRTQLSNALRAHLAEFGVIAPVGRLGLERLIAIIADPGDPRLPAGARTSLRMLVAQLAVVKTQILENDRRIMADARGTDLGRRLMTIPGVGPLLASALTATVADPRIFRSGRDLAAWIGLVPRQNSSGGKERLGSISKAGHRYLRQMLVVGSMVIRHAEHRARERPWLAQLLARKKAKVAAVALANKIARTVWAMMITGERYREPLAA